MAGVLFCPEMEEKQMAEGQTLMPGDIPDWVKEAEEQMQKEGPLEGQEKKEVSIKFGKGLVGEPFTSKSGHQLVEVKIPNQDPADKTPWASFVISPKMIHDNKFGKGVWMKLPEDGTTKVSKPIFIGTKPDGKNVWERNVRDVPNTELKAMMETYKNKDRSSVLGALEDKKKETEKALRSPKPVKSKTAGMEK
jgi:hypothetical protein